MHARIIEVLAAPSSLRHGGVFVLDAGSRIFQWAGGAADAAEKSKGLDIVHQLRASKDGTPTVGSFAPWSLQHLLRALLDAASVASAADETYLPEAKVKWKRCTVTVKQSTFLYIGSCS